MKSEDLPQELARCLGCRAKPCEKACPLSVSPHDFIAAAKSGDYKAAAALIAERNPLPQTCGLVCPDRFCQKACIRARIDAALEIPCLQAAVIRKDGLPPLELPPAEDTGRPKKAAVIGGGPAGLGALHEFLRHGWHIDLYEKNARLGGAARLIPEYRLPRAVLDAEITRLVENDRVTLHLNTTVNDISALVSGYDAVVAALGEPAPRRLGIRGEENTLPYTNFLSAPEYRKSRKAAVIGGGEVAMDCALTLKKQSCPQVEMFVRRRREDMRIMARDQAALDAHGIIVRALSSVTEIIPDGKGGYTLHAVTNRINDAGRAEAIPETACELAGYDMIIMALGSFFPPAEIPAAIATAGDMSGTCGTVVQALASGMDAARRQIAAFAVSKEEG